METKHNKIIINDRSKSHVIFDQFVMSTNYCQVNVIYVPIDMKDTQGTVAVELCILSEPVILILNKGSLSEHWSKKFHMTSMSPL